MDVISRILWIEVGLVVTKTYMGIIGNRVEETGTLIRDGGGYALRRDQGGRWKLDIHRVPVDHVEKRVRISGVVVAESLVDVESLGPEKPFE